MSGGETEERTASAAEIGASRAPLGRLADELAAQEELLEQLLAHLASRGGRTGALKGTLGPDQVGVLELQARIALQKTTLDRAADGVLTALRARRRQVERLRRALVSQREEVAMLGEAVRDSGRLERSLRRELRRRR